MLSPAKPRRLDQPIAVSLEELVPQDHFYRHLEAKFDLGFVRDWTQELYAERGQPSIDPVVWLVGSAAATNRAGGPWRFLQHAGYFSATATLPGGGPEVV